jgi:hypothetical protein
VSGPGLPAPGRLRSSQLRKRFQSLPFFHHSRTSQSPYQSNPFP